ncbi:hypothetical protein TWF970_001294 [Orbilia oligospora]|uniref:Uncharacterized protein n=1 Tax=Orbilia oligospora TaxID=2813651 RepID=A0A7C8RBQ4_ORBOL|nr:hypothetical protein TWF970_001294 [Orbilia oligospora]
MQSQRITSGSYDQNETAVFLATQYQTDTVVPGAIERESNDTEMADAGGNTSAREHKEGEDGEDEDESEESGAEETEENDGGKSEDENNEDDEAKEQGGQVVGDNNQPMVVHGGDPMVIEDLGAIDLDGDNDMTDLMEELSMGLEKREEVRKEEKEEEEQGQGTKLERGWAYFTGQWSPNLHVSNKLLYFNLHLTEEEVEWCRKVMTTGRNINGDETTKSLADYVREGQYDLQHRICEIGKWAIHSGTTQHARHSQYELWVHKIANSIGQLEAFAENFDLGKILGCDQETSELPLTGSEVLALIHICGKYLGTGVDRELIMGLDILTVSVIFDAVPIPYVDPEIVHFILDTARRCSQRKNGSGFGPWGQIDFQDIDLSGDKVTQFGSADRSLTGDQDLNNKVKPAELLTMIMVKAIHPVPSRIQRHFPKLATLFMDKGLECNIGQLKKKRGQHYVCKAVVKCAGLGFKVWTVKARAKSTGTVIKNLSIQLYHEIESASQEFL